MGACGGEVYQVGIIEVTLFSDPRLQASVLHDHHLCAVLRRVPRKAPELRRRWEHARQLVDVPLDPPRVDPQVLEPVASAGPRGGAAKQCNTAEQRQRAL